MLKTLYKRYEFIINLIVVMYLLVLARMLDWIAWTPPSPDRLHVILIRHLCEFIAFFPIIFLIISGYTRALKRKNYVLLVVLIIILTVFGPTLVKFLSNWLETIVSGKVVAPVDNPEHTGSSSHLGKITRFWIRSPFAGVVQNQPVHTSAAFSF
jgi:hypothetical protein